MKPAEILNSQQVDLTLKRLCFELIENHDNFEDTVILGLQPRGIYLAHRLEILLIEILHLPRIDSGSLDITFFRDDVRRKDLPPKASETHVDVMLEDKKVILVDDVLYTGRTARAGLDAMLSFGRPRKVELLVLIDRRFSRQLPIQPDYTGKWVDTIHEERVSVDWKETEGTDRVLLFTPNQNHE